MTTSLPANLPKLSALYDQDYSLWLEATATLLRSGKLSELDVVNLLEEIEDMGRSEKRAVYSNLKIVLLHLLKYRYQPGKRCNSWRYSIVEHRQRIKRAFQESPSLKPYLDQAFHEGYQEARELVAAETGLAVDTFSTQSPFNPEEIFHPDYFGDAEK